MNCAIYARTSTRDRGQDFTNQLFALREFAAKQGWHVHQEYVDQVTGSTDERPAFQQMFQDASQRRFDVLLFWSLDRLSREGVLETLQHLQRLTSYAVAWRSFTEQYLDSTGIFREAVRKLGRPVARVDASAIRALRGAGASWSEIARRTGLARATCQKVYGQVAAATTS